MKNLITTICLITITYGCQPPPPPAEHTDIHPTFSGTVGSYCDLSGYDPVRVHAFSLVVGLQNTGSSECPPAIRNYLVNHLRSIRDSGLLPQPYRSLSIEQIFNRLDTAVVEVSGVVPPGAPSGERFDVDVAVASGTQTTSLQGGWLIPSELRVIVGRNTGQQLARSATAKATGPIFINPLPLTSLSPQKADPRRGIVLGGGMSTADRIIRLSLLRPDFRIAQQIQNRLNSRFEEADGPRIAEATRENITLRIPPSYHDRYNHFISLAWALYLQDSRSFIDNKLRELQDLARQPDQDYEMIALAWEAIGRPALPSLQILYSEPEPSAISFYAARTAVNFGDNRAYNALIVMAQKDNHPYQLPALKTLCENVSDIRVTAALRNLINHPNSQIKMLAYQGLRQSANLSIQPVAAAADFKLELVNTPGENIILVCADTDPRIAIFGSDLQCRQNIFFEAPDYGLTINADTTDQRLTLTRKLPGTGEYLSRKCPFAVSDLVQALARPWKNILDETPRAPGLNFSQIVGILFQLCQQEVIPAQFKIQRITQDLIDAVQN